MNSIDKQLRAEQDVVDVLYRRLDELRAQTRDRLARVRQVGPSGSPQNRSERDAFATLYEDRVARLEAVEDRLAFGRLDLVDGERRYIGRIGLNDEEHAPLLTDWRAPAAQAFYRATAAHPDGVVLRRHLVTRGRSVTGVEDELLDLSAVGEDDEQQLSGEGALLAALAARRTGRMGDIVATIQAEQDAVIRSALQGALVVQGGPGTGKTAVALHRAAYLLYNHRRVLERSGVLLIGPSRTFLRYIDQVLPSLGETGVVSTTVGELFPGVVATGAEDDAVAEIKGRPVWREVIERAVKQRQRVPAEPVRVVIDGRTVVVKPSDVRAAIHHARRGHRPHNQARVTFVRDMLGRLAEQYISQLAFAVAPEDRGEILEELRSTREIRIALNLAWMPLTPQGLVSSLFAKPQRLADAAAGVFSRAERRRLERPADAPWTVADIPLLDEAAELLGEDDQAAKAQARLDAEQRHQELDYARQVLQQSGNALVSADVLADRFASSGPVLTTAERAAADRAWAYGHVVVDEAQELSAMAWRMILRRVPTRSLTVVGDVAQTSTAAGTRDWSEVFDRMLAGQWRQETLTVNYRTPATVTRAAEAVGRAAGLPLTTTEAARDVANALITEQVTVEDLPAAAARWAVAEVAAVRDASGAGRVAVIAAPSSIGAVRDALIAGGHEDLIGATRTGAPDLDAAITPMTAEQSKGLEFDAVVLVEPDAVLTDGGPGDLYVAMTRPTTALRVVHHRPLPAGWPSA